MVLAEDDFDGDERLERIRQSKREQVYNKIEELEKLLGDSINIQLIINLQDVLK